MPERPPFKLNRMPGTPGVSGSGALVTLSFQAIGKGRTTVIDSRTSRCATPGTAGRRRQPADWRSTSSRRHGTPQEPERTDAGGADRGLHDHADPHHHGGAAGALRVRAERERELRSALDEMRTAIDKYKDNCDLGYFGPAKLGTNCYPETLESWWRA